MTIDTTAAPPVQIDERQRSFLGRYAYLLLSAFVVVLMLGWTFNERWTSPDFWVHLAAVREFAHDPLHPANPLVIGGDPDPYLSPYAFVLGLVTRATGIDAITALAVAGMLSLVALLYALAKFVRTVSAATYAPVFLLAATLVAWGVNPWRWSGFFELNSLGAVLPLSSTIASALGLLTVVATHAWMQRGRAPQLVLVGAGAVLVPLCHPMTAVWVGGLVAAFVVSDATRVNLRRVIALAVVGVGAVVPVALWPFFPALRLLGASDTFDASNTAMYSSLATRLFLAVPGVVVLAVRARRRWRDPLVLGALINGAIYAAGFVSDHRVFGRVLPGIVLVVHTAIAVWLAEVAERWNALDRRRQLAVRSGVIAVVVIGILGCTAGLVRPVPRGLLPSRYADDERLASLVDPYEPVRGLIDRDDVVVASPDLALGVAASSGRVIAPPAPAPFVDDVEQRRRAVAGLLSPETSATAREQLIRRYGVDWFVVPPSEVAELTAGENRALFRERTRSRDLAVLETVRAPSGSTPEPAPAPTPTPTPTPTAPTAPVDEDAGTTEPTGPVRRVPDAIASDCSVDVASQLSDWIDAAPRGSRLELAPDGCYRIDGTVALENKRDILLDGKGATLEAKTTGDRTRSHLKLERCVNVIVRNLTVHGANPDAGATRAAYHEDLEAQHAFELLGVRNVLLDAVQATDTYGDFVYVGNSRSRDSEHVAVTRSTFARSGRQGMSVTDGTDVAIVGNDISD
ncbi:MAG TPA: hypothetical protein VFX21_00700, partial [Acidimicrobiia bacterium]|nr:hypothetical protein [Acidimicrobiia bacterium]